MSNPFDKLEECAEKFNRLGWDASIPKPTVDYGYDIVLRHNDEVYGAVVVISSNFYNKAAHFKAKHIKKLVENALVNLKPKVFVITNGFTFDVYHFGEFYGCLTVPPTPEDVDILFGGEEE